MVEVGKEILGKNNVSDLNDVRWALQLYTYLFPVCNLEMEKKTKL